jgi:hypothetical protein
MSNTALIVKKYCTFAELRSSVLSAKRPAFFVIDQLKMIAYNGNVKKSQELISINERIN